MATQAQILANRANAQKSTGPRTEEGKARSSQNHLSHGLTSALVFIPLEERQDFNCLLAELREHHQPANLDEDMLVEKIAQSQWLSLRAYRLQGVALAASIPQGYTHPDLGVLIRYHQSSERGFYHARTELLKAQKERKKSEIGFESQKPAAPEPEPESAPDPAPNPETSSAEPADIPDFTPLQWKIDAIMNEPVEEMFRESLDQYTSAQKAA
jgi:hypothetical protein